MSYSAKAGVSAAGPCTLYLTDGRPAYTYNWVGLKCYTVGAEKPLPPGKATVSFDFAYDGGKPGSGGTGTLHVNGEKVAQGRIEHTNAFLFSGDETADVGVDDATPVAKAYGEGHASRFTGKIHKVSVEVR